jgi:ADP-ribose pyrophosphatase YjhB (NUDIX family)
VPGSPITEVAAQVGVDPKTVERWIVLGRIPHRSHRWATASLLGTDEAHLWPELADERRTQVASTSELVTLFPNRGAVPGALWRSLLEAASDRIEVLVDAGLFMPDGYPEIAKLLASKAEQGTKVRLTLGDPDSDAVRRRGEEERIGDGLAARVRLGLLYLRDAIGAPGVELRFHATTLYNSLYRFDDDLLVNAHVYGAPAAHSPGAAPAPPARRSAVRPLPGLLRASLGAGQHRQRPRGARPGRKAIAVARIDYFNDPNAPKANSIVPSVTAIVPNERGELLLVRKTDNDLWALPGGGMDVGESMADTVVREVKEETGIDVEVTGVVGIYTNPNHDMAYDDGEVRQQCSICFTTRMLGGQLATSSETSEVEFVAPERLGQLNIHPSMRLRIDHYLERRSAPYIG